MQILGQIGSAGGTKYVKYNASVACYTAVAFFTIFSTGQTAALAHMLNDSNDVFLRKEVPLGG